MFTLIPHLLLFTLICRMGLVEPVVTASVLGLDQRVNQPQAGGESEFKLLQTARIQVPLDSNDDTLDDTLGDILEGQEEGKVPALGADPMVVGLGGRGG